MYDISEPLFRQILSFSPRWKHIELSMSFSIYQKLESLISGDALPLLHSLQGDIHWSEVLSEPPFSFPVRFLEAPNLQRLSLHSPQLSHKITMVPPIWGRLTDLRIQSAVSDVDFFNIIKLCHNLITCQVDDMQGSQDDPAQQFRPQTEVIIPKLQMVKIHELRGTSDVVQAINAPSLKFLTYWRPPRDGYHNESYLTLMRADGLLALVERGASTLRKLTLEPQSLLSEDIVMCLQLVNKVSHLVLKCYPYYSRYPENDTLRDDFFNLDLFIVHDSPCPSESRDILLPKLEVLEMNDVYQFTDEDVLRLLTTRMDAARRGDVSPLRRLKLHFARHRQRDIREEVSERAKSAGYELSLELDYPPDDLRYNERLSPYFLDPSIEEAWPPAIDS